MRREFGQGTWRERAKLYDDQCRRSVAAAIATKETTMEPPKAPNYSKLKSGEWGVRLEGTAKTGDIINVVRKDGKVKPEKLGKLVWEGGGAQLYAIDKGDAQEVAI
jgi:hypothetical protein